MNLLRLIPLLLFATVVSAMGGDSHVVRGAVFERGTGARLSGVRVELLLEGVRAVEEARTDENGQFQLEARAGTYDLRAVAPGRRHVAEVRRDLEVGGSGREDLQFELLPFDQALASQGLDPGDLLDEDGDFVPDRLERAYRLDPRNADSNGDGVSDGAAALLGVGTRAQARNRDVALHSPLGALSVPAPGSSGSISVPIVTEAMPGAVRYALEVRQPGSDVVLNRQEFDFERGGFLIGEGIALRWKIPVRLGAGRYELELLGYAPGESEPVRNRSK